MDPSTQPLLPDQPADMRISAGSRYGNARWLCAAPGCCHCTEAVHGLPPIWWRTAFMSAAQRSSWRHCCSTYTGQAAESAPDAARAGWIPLLLLLLLLLVAAAAAGLPCSRATGQPASAAARLRAHRAAPPPLPELRCFTGQTCYRSDSVRETVAAPWTAALYARLSSAHTTPALKTFKLGTKERTESHSSAGLAHTMPNRHCVDGVAFGASMLEHQVCTTQQGGSHANRNAQLDGDLHNWDETCCDLARWDAHT